MITEHESEQMQRGFVGGGAIISPVMSVGALIALVLGETWAVWPFIALAACAIVFVTIWIRRRRRALSARSAR